MKGLVDVHAQPFFKNNCPAYVDEMFSTYTQQNTTQIKGFVNLTEKLLKDKKDCHT